jgi:hypothetical protein
MDKNLRLEYPSMVWVKFFGEEAVRHWNEFNSCNQPFFVLCFGGVLGQHVDDELLSAVDRNRGSLIIHQYTAGLLDGIYKFDRILANCDSRALYPLCQEFMVNLEDWGRHCEALLKDPRLFVDLQRGSSSTGLFRIDD